MSDVTWKATVVGRSASSAWHRGLYGTQNTPLYGEGDLPDAVVNALSTSGLLRTGVERDCVEACRAAYRETGYGDTRAVWSKCQAAGRAALEAEKPKERWRVVGFPAGGGCWQVCDGRATDVTTGAVAWRERRTQ